MSEQGVTPEVLPGDLITGPGVYMSRSNNPVEVRDCGNGYWEAAWQHGDLRYHSSGERVGVCALDDPYKLIRWVGPLAEDIPTTSEQLAEIKGQEEQEPESEPVQVREGRWRTRGGEVKNIRPCEPLKGAHFVWPWTDGFMTFQDNGRHQGSKDSVNDLVEYLGPIEEQPKPQSEPQPEPQAADTPTTEYTPPEGWRVLQVGEELRQGDVRVDDSGACSAVLVTVNGVVPHGRRYIRPIEPQPQPQPQPKPQPQPVQVREGRWRTRGGDIRNVTPTPEGDGRKYTFPWWDAQYRQTWTSDGRYYLNTADQRDLIEYLGPIEQQAQPESVLEPEKLPEGCRNDGGWSSVNGIEPEPWPEPQPQLQPQPEAEPVQVREGRWRTRRGEVKYIRAGGSLRDTHYSWPWTDGLMCFQDNGFYQASKPCDDDLVEYLGLIEPEPVPEPQPEPVQVREGRWRTRGGQVRNVTRTPEHDGRALQYPWWDAQSKQVWTPGGKYYTHISCGLDLAEYLGPLEQQPEIQPEPQEQRESDAELRIRLLKQANDSQAETIGRLLTEARDLNMEIGGLQRRLSEREARIRDLETMHAAATQAVVDAGKQNDALRLQVQNQQQEYERQKGRIEFLETLNAGNGAAIDNYRAMVAKLQSLVDTARQQLEAAATERDELRAAIDQADKQLDEKDAEIRDLRIELDAAQQVPQPVSDDERERIWDEATEAAGRQVMRWLRPMIAALNKQPNERFQRFMALTLSVLPDLLPELLGYAVEEEAGEE